MNRIWHGRKTAVEKLKTSSKYDHLVERLVHHNLVHQSVLLYNYFIQLNG